MKNTNYEYTHSNDVNEVSCDVHNAELFIAPTNEKSIRFYSENDKGLHISCDESKISIKINVKKKLFFNKKKRVYLYIPAHLVPEINIAGKSCDVKVDGGIYNNLALLCDNCSVTLNDCAFDGCELIGSALSTYLTGVTVKNALVVKSESGDMLWENSFAACTECRVNRGNIGLNNFNCKDSILEAKHGNVAARLNGDESDYSLGLMIKEGTANRESVQREGAARSFKAYSAKGTIAIDFLPEKINGAILENNLESGDC